MCGTCGCGEDRSAPRFVRLDDDHGLDVRAHAHGSPNGHVNPNGQGNDEARTVLLAERVLARNDELAAANRRRLADRRVRAVNLMSSPGSGKTTLLERTVRDLGKDRPIAVVEGDQETALDAERMRAAGCPVVQVNTGQGCHLDAAMLDRALTELDPAPGSLVFVENVGNLVCPALFDLGEDARVVLMSVTEGEDKPAKYAPMFATADVMLLTKSDLLPHLDFDLARCVGQIRRINPAAPVLLVSATRGQGLAQWYGWLSGMAGSQAAHASERCGTAEGFDCPPVGQPDGDNRTCGDERT